MAQGIGDSVVVDVGGGVVGGVDCFFGGVSHGYTDVGELQHVGIVVAVAEGHDVVWA